MSANVQLIWKKIDHLRRMRNYLDYSLEQTLLGSSSFRVEFAVENMLL